MNYLSIIERQKCNKTSLLSWNTNWNQWNGAPTRRRNARRGWQWWNSPMRFPGARHESSIRSMRKGDSLSGVSLSPILIPSPTLASTIFGSPAPAVREEHPWGLPDTSIGVSVSQRWRWIEKWTKITCHRAMTNRFGPASDVGFGQAPGGEAKRKKKESIFTLFLYLQESST